jgi:uncharacterized protein YbjT (DUF2867 family)
MYAVKAIARLFSLPGFSPLPAARAEITRHSGSLQWTEEQLKHLEIGVVGTFSRGVRQAGVAQFCLLSAVGAKAGSRTKYARIMGLKEAAIQAVNFPRLAIFRHGIIVSNAHTPRWVGRLDKLVPSPWGNIEQRNIGKAFVAEIAKKAAATGVDFYDNQGMRKSIADFTGRLFAA